MWGDIWKLRSVSLGKLDKIILKNCDKYSGLLTYYVMPSKFSLVTGTYLLDYSVPCF